MTGYKNEYIVVSKSGCNPTLLKAANQSDLLYFLSKSKLNASDYLVNHDGFYIHELKSESLVPNSNYTLVEFLGLGSFSNVFLGLDADKNRVAIKQPKKLSDIPKGEQNSVILEIKNQIHENSYFDLAQEGLKKLTYEKLTMILYYCQKQKSQKLSRQSPPPGILNVVAFNDSALSVIYPLAGRSWVEQAGSSLHSLINTFFQLAEALSYLHDLGMYHNDIKVNNIVTGPNGPAFIDYNLNEKVRGVNQYYKVDGNEQDEFTEVFALGSVFYFCIANAKLSANNKLRESCMSVKQLLLLKQSLRNLSSSNNYSHAFKLFNLVNKMLSSKNSRPTAKQVKAELACLLIEFKE
jgi:serine/threonine protein kinase